MPKKIPDTTFSRSYDFLRLDRRDIQQIIDTVGTDEQPAEIVSEGYAYSSVAEIAEHFAPRRISEMQISGSGIRVTLGTERSTIIATFWGQKDSSVVIAKCVALDGLLSARRRWLNGIVVWGGRMIAIVVGLNGLLFLAYRDVPMARRLTFTAVALSIALVLLLALHAYRTVLVLDEKHEPFVQRNKEKIVVAVATAAVTALLTFAAQKAYEQVAGPKVELVPAAKGSNP